MKSAPADPHPYVDKLFESWRRGDKIHRGNRNGEAIDAWSSFWRQLTSRLPSNVRSFADAEPVWPFFEHLPEWASMFADLYRFQPKFDPRAAAAGLAFLDEFLSTFPDEQYDCYLLRCGRGVFLFQLGREEEGTNEFEALIRERPDSGAAYAEFADALDYSAADAPVVFERRRKLFERAVAVPITDDDIWELGDGLKVLNGRREIVADAPGTKCAHCGRADRTGEVHDHKTDS